jgi:hypothetical protein
MRYRNPLFGILSVVVAGLLLNIFKETSWAIFVETLLEEAAHSLGIGRAAMVATLSQILLGGGILWTALYFAFRVGKIERPMPSDPAVEAQRQHTNAILAQTAALKINSKPPVALAARESAAFDPNWVRDALLGEAIWRAYSGNWSGWLQLNSTDEATFRYIAEQIRQYAFEGLLPIWGRRSKSTLFEPIAKDFWRNHALQASYSIACTIPDVFVYVTDVLIVGEVRNARTVVWEEFMTSREVVGKLWPTRC